MDPTVPAPAAKLLDFIGQTEAPKGYDTIYGNNQGKLRTPITKLRLSEVIAAGPTWTHSYKSSACGRYQFMHATLMGLKTVLNLSGNEYFNPDLQDRLGYHLLKECGYTKWASGATDDVPFALALAKVWASFPVLTETPHGTKMIHRGQSYYAGDGLNKALISPEKIEALLASAKSTAPAAPVPVKESPMSTTNRPVVLPGTMPTKPWYQSIGVLGSLLAIIAPVVGGITGLNINSTTVTDAVNLGTAGFSIIGGLIALWGRVRAKTEIA